MGKVARKPQTSRGAKTAKTRKAAKKPKKNRAAKLKTPLPEQEPLSVEDAKNCMLQKMSESGYDGNHFAEHLVLSTESRKKRGKSPRKIRYAQYCSWAYALVRLEIGPVDAEFQFPESVLAYIRAIVPGDVKGEIREDAFKVTMDSFCHALDLLPSAHSAAQ